MSQAQDRATIFIQKRKDQMKNLFVNLPCFKEEMMVKEDPIKIREDLEKKQI